jgi:hypothetical protein
LKIAFLPLGVLILAAGGPPRLTLTVEPPMPAILETAPLGTEVATLTAGWSNGRPFKGTFSFVPPYADDNKTFAISGDRLVLNPAGPGVNGDAGSVHHVTVQASQ